MKLRKIALATTLAAAVVVAALGSTSVTQAAPKPGFPPGTWIGAGEMFAETGVDGDLIASMSGSMKFTLTVTRDGKLSGTGTVKTLETGAGSVGARITGTAPVKFSGTPIDVRYSGTQTVTTWFKDAVHTAGTTFTRKLSGGLVIKEARSCLVSGGHTAAGEGPWVKFRWQARLKGVKCP
jgi:hypothetical protein